MNANMGTEEGKCNMGGHCACHLFHKPPPVLLSPSSSTLQQLRGRGPPYYRLQLTARWARSIYTTASYVIFRSPATLGWGGDHCPTPAYKTHHDRISYFMDFLRKFSFRTTHGRKEDIQGNNSHVTLLSTAANFLHMSTSTHPVMCPYTEQILSHTKEVFHEHGSDC